MSGTAGQQIAAAGTMPQIGTYVQDAAEPNGQTNFIGCNPEIAYTTDVLGLWNATSFTCPTNEESAAGGIASWVVLDTSGPLIPTDTVTIASGVATKDNSTGTHTCFANVLDGEYFWAVDVA